METENNSGINWYLVLFILILAVKIFGIGILGMIFMLLFFNALDPW